MSRPTTESETASQDHDDGRPPPTGRIEPQLPHQERENPSASSPPRYPRIPPIKQTTPANTSPRRESDVAKTLQGPPSQSRTNERCETENTENTRIPEEDESGNQESDLNVKEQNSSNSRPKDSARKKKKKIMIIVCISCLLVVVAAVAIAMVIALKGSKEKDIPPFVVSTEKVPAVAPATHKTSATVAPTTTKTSTTVAPIVTKTSATLAPIATKTSTTVAPIATTKQVIEQVIVSSVEIPATAEYIHIAFTDAYHDSASLAYRELELNFTGEMDLAFMSGSYADVYNGTLITVLMSSSRGRIFVDFVVVLLDIRSLVNTSSVVDAGIIDSKTFISMIEHTALEIVNSVFGDFNSTFLSKGILLRPSTSDAVRVKEERTTTQRAIEASTSTADVTSPSHFKTSTATRDVEPTENPATGTVPYVPSDTTTTAVHWNWTEWSDWSMCSISCGGNGTQTRNRSCSNPALAPGCSDGEPSNETQTCGTHECAELGVEGCSGACRSIPRVDYISPNRGSLRGATRVTIHGQAFSEDSFSFGDGNEDKGNRVWFWNKTTSFECDVLDYYSNKNKIVCETRSASTGPFDIYVEIDGQSIKDRGGRYCSIMVDCRFTYTVGRTPTIQAVTPTYNLPGNTLTIRGKILTELYDTTQLGEADEYDKDAIFIERIYWGAQIICDPEDPDTENLYGIKLDSKDSHLGEIICRPDSPLVGSYRITYLISTYGRSLSKTNVLFVDHEHKLYHYQTHADILSVYPTEGSLAGGTDLTIVGQYFDHTDPDIHACIGGIPCEIYNVSRTEILCRTSAVNELVDHENATVFPGGRGITWEVWSDTYGELVDESLWNTSKADYCWKSLEFSRSPGDCSCGETDLFIARLRGFFVPPADGDYSLALQGDEQAILYLSQSSRPADMEQVALLPGWATDFYKYDSQVSEKFYLKGNVPYYIEGRLRDAIAYDFIQVGVFIYDTPLVESQYSGAVAEEQIIMVTPNIQYEHQSLTYDVPLQEIQEVRVSSTCPGLCNKYDESGSGFPGNFRLSYNGDTTDDIEVGASAMEVQHALNQLLINFNSTSSSDETLSVTVTSYMEGSVTVYKIVFNDIANYSMLMDATYDPNVQASVSRVAAGRENGTAPSSFQILYGGKLSTDLSFADSADDVRATILDLFKVQCECTRRGEPFYFVDYESDALGNEYGTRVNEDEPFCGQTSLKNPSWIFYEILMGNMTHFDVRYMRKLCFAHRGTGFQKRFFMSICWIDKIMKSRFESMSIYHDFPQSDHWEHSCIDLFDHVKESWFYDLHLTGTPLYVDRIRVYEVVGEFFWVDNIFIGSEDDSYGFRVPAAKPGGKFIQDVNVSRIEHGFNVELVPALCGYDFPLMSVSGADINNITNSSDAGYEQVTYSSTEWDEGASLTVKSVKQAYPPVVGTFTIMQENGAVVKDISGQSTEEQMKDLLETFLDTGALGVNRTGTCYGYTWNVKWISKGGSQGLMHVTENNLYNNITEVNVTAYRFAEGGVMLSKIPAQFLRTAHDKPQVEVIVNSIPSSCSDDSCTFEYTQAATPTLVSVTPTQGSAHDGTSITITGTGFSIYSTENNVTIGSADCTVTSSSETTIVCDVGPAQGGVFNVLIAVDGKGYAYLPSGGVEFEYTFGITGVSPSAGSSTGGTEVTLSGYGLGGMTDVDISVGSNNCVIQSRTYDEIICLVVVGASSRRRKRSTTDVDIVVVIGDGTVTVTNGFTYDNSLTPTVSTIDPEYSSVLGGGDLTISGSSFGTSGARVMIGSLECSVTSQTASSIVCELPDSPPGDYKIDVRIEGVGLADTSAIGLFSYVLKVTGIFPDTGSMQGGTLVTITGAGFGTDPGNITVSMGDLDCEVKTVADNELTCIARSTTVTHYVDNNGRHNTYGRGYKWDPQYVTVKAGDRVSWSWTIDPYVTGIGYSIQQTINADALEYDGTGFYSGERSTSSGSYTYRFFVPGLYYYCSAPVNNLGTIFMKGVVEVLHPVSSAMELDVSVGQYNAIHHTTSGVADPSGGGGGCSGEDTAISGCEGTSPSGNDSDTFYFKYDVCMTPVISTIDPLVGDSSDTIVIEGSGFSSDDCANEVMVGDYPCDVTSSSSTRIECKIDTMDTMEVGVYHMISVNVANRGYALHESAVLADQSFVMYPRIDSVSDDAGSIEGGLTISMQGDGFAPSSPSAIGMNVGPLACGIDFYNYTYIECTTPAALSYGVFSLRVQVNSLWAKKTSFTATSFEYRADQTPVVKDWSPASVSGDSTRMTFSGSQLSTSATNVTVSVGGEACIVASTSETQIDCDVGFVPVGNRSVRIHLAGKGLALFYYGNDTVTSLADIFSVSQTSGSTEGGQKIIINGNGFVDGATNVSIDNELCRIESLSLSEIACTTPEGSLGTWDLVVVSDGVTYAAQNYTYALASTPTIDSISPTSGSTGDSITISGSAFSDHAGDVTVEIDGVGCSVTSASTTQVQCDAGPHAAGVFTLTMHVAGLGNGDSNKTFEYELIVTSTSPSQGSFAGGQRLVIEGSGYDETTTVTVCGNDCPFYSVNETTIECDTPVNSNTSDTVDCDIVVCLPSNSTMVESNAYQYRQDLTPVIYSVFPARGGTGGGTNIIIVGNDFLDVGNVVTIAGTTCSILTENTTLITCQTGAHTPSERTKVRVEVGSQGIATQDDADFFYIDVWSSIYTWGGLHPPIEGDFVIIPTGQTILLDISTPILKVLLIQGGEMIFDEADIELHAEYVVIVAGGHFEIGTEDQPFEHEASVVMHGNVRSKEIPLFGAKTFAVRNGTVDMHGRPTPITWSYLAQIVHPGKLKLTLTDAVNWRVGDHIVLASTAPVSKLAQNEEVVITGISNGNKTLSFTPAVEFRHISYSQVVDGVAVETRGEVGLLTHNVKIRGSVSEDWAEEVEACPDEFDTNQFGTQTCSQGRLGTETATDQFGSQMMFFAKEQDQDLVRGRLEYIEVTHAGQASRLGRYPINFHMSGDITGSYVRGCSIHHTFNRAVAMHGVHHLLVERNVAYNVMGHAYFLEDGIETKNIIQYNLAVFIRPSTSLLNVDVTPAGFWVTNPDNYVRHNAVAGSRHFGFWYNLQAHPGGPSFTSEICPVNVPVLQFYNNTAHTLGGCGIWIFPTYFPLEGGSCSGSSTPAQFHKLTTWRCQCGAEGVAVGAVQFHSFLMTDNQASAIEFQTVSGPWGDQGPLIKDSVIIGYSDELAGGSPQWKCTSVGIQLPKSKFLTVDAVKMINFDQSRCVTLKACGRCKSFEGGFQHRFKNMEFTNSPNKASFKWEHETWFEDLDGTLTGLDAGYLVTPTNQGLPSDHCAFDNDEWSLGFPAKVCDDTVKLHRMAFNKAKPSSLLSKNAILTNSHGTTTAPFRYKRLTHTGGWMLTLVESETYNFFFEDVDHLTNISYTARFDEFSDGEYVVINHNFTQSPDAILLTGQVTENVGHPLSYDDTHADWYFDNETNNMFYIISGKGESYDTDPTIDLVVFRCYDVDNCILPMPEAPPNISIPTGGGRPTDDDVLYWGEAETWAGVSAGWGGNTDSGSDVPEDGDDVMIMPGLWVVANVALPWMNKLFIYGTLEIDDQRDMLINATYILIQGGQLIAGFNETHPFIHDLRILLNGHHFTEDIPIPNGPNLGSKALGVFGTLNLHGRPRDVSWTRLAATVQAGDSQVTVAVDTDWDSGDMIVVASTSFEAWHTETFTISSKIDARTFNLDGTFAHMHTVEQGSVNGISYIIAAEVGLLTRNIVIEGNEYDLLSDESFGARTIVGSFFHNWEFYKGSGHFANVEFKLTGQEGWTDFYDPRFSLSFLNIGDVLEDPEPSYVKSCTFHHGFSPAIGVFGTDNIEIDNNVFYHTVGAGITSLGRNTLITNNLVTLMVFPGTYQDRMEARNVDWMGGIDVAEADDPVLINNTVVGSERVGFNIQGEKCGEPNVWSNNVVHSSYHGVHILKTGHRPCTLIKDFVSYRNFDYGVFALTFSDVEMRDLVLIDNTAGVFVSSYSPPALLHVRKDKKVLIENSLFVGYSQSFDCDKDKVTPKGSSQSWAQRPAKSPGGGNVGVFFANFMSSSGNAPGRPFHKVTSYPGIGGRTIVRDTIFSSFNDHCGANAKAIMTNPKTGDAIHPMEVKNVTYVDTPTKNYLWIHRPDLGLVNPSDCVDMDCDAKKKVLIKDLDGSLLGRRGTVIPDSAFEWDGDRRRGLGDHRIPKIMLTSPDGARIPKDDIAPNNGIIRNNNCEWHENWQSWECHGLDHMMMVVESMDVDTEVRRISPVALVADGFVDLINGPQDHGWCLGYTCQERISTFYTIVAPKKNYELYFTGTTPQSLRFHLLNAKRSQALTVGIWYDNPQRLDVYVNGLYIIPTNGEYVNGRLQWIAPGPDTDFFPSLDSMVLGDNYFDRDLGTLFILVRGSKFVEIRTTPVVITTFGVPPVEVDNFFEENLVANLANLLNIAASQIRVVNVISEAGRKKRSSSDAEIAIEIGESPAATTGGFGNATFTTPATATDSTTTTTTLDFSALLDVQAEIAAEMQTGRLGDSLGITINSLSMTDPVEEPVDPTGGLRATNATGGPANGTMTFAERQAKEAELALSTNGHAVEYLIVATLELVVEPAEAIEGISFGQQPKLRVLDNNGNLVEQLGTKGRPWRLTATISSVTSERTVSFIGENETIAFIGGWANFTDIGVNTAATDLMIEFVVTHPSTSTLTASSSAFIVEALPYKLVAITSPTLDVAENQAFEVTVELQDSNTGKTANLADKGYEWWAEIAISHPSNYRGELQGDVGTTLDLNTARATFELFINAFSYYYLLEVIVTTSPGSLFSPSVSLTPFNVVAEGATSHSGEAASLTIRFGNDYSSIAEGKEELLAANFLNHIAPNYPEATFSHVQISEGSIVITFDITGNVDYVQSQMWEDILDGDLSLTFNGQIMVADEYFLVDGTSYLPTVPTVSALPTVPTVPALPTVPTSSGSGPPVWVFIIIIIIVVLIIPAAIGVIVLKKQAANNKVAAIQETPLQSKEPQPSPDAENLVGSEPSGSMAPAVVLDPRPSPPPEGIINKSLPLDNNENNSQSSMLPACSRSAGIHSAQRSPEVSVVALPPGSVDGHVETDM